MKVRLEIINKAGSTIFTNEADVEGADESRSLTEYRRKWFAADGSGAYIDNESVAIFSMVNPDATPQPATHTVTVWQYGRMIFTGAAVVPVSVRESGAVEVIDFQTLRNNVTKLYIVWPGDGTTVTCDKI